ncbi:MAG: beta-ketoacyl-ACP synthase III [Candidatus Diapherotrites archaeon]
MFSEIKGIGAHLPGKELDNEEVIAIKGIDTSDKFIRERFGVQKRRVIEGGEKNSDLGAEALKKAAEKAGITLKEIDAIVCATMTPEKPSPSTACIIQGKLGLKGVPAFDVSAACSGFVYGLDSAARMVSGGEYKNIALVATETMSKIVDWSDRVVCPVFGDAGTATIVSHSKKEKVLATHLTADGGGSGVLHVPENEKFLRMNGKDVYEFAVKLFPETARKTVKKAGIGLKDIDWVFPHQANINIIRDGMKELGLGMEKTHLNMQKYGNTAAASIPLAIEEAERIGKVKKGDLLLCVGFGAGWSAGGAVVEW